jgi:hypothetical protein
MDIYDPIAEALGIDPRPELINPDLSEYPKIESAWTTNLNKFRWKSSEWKGTETYEMWRNKISSTLKGRPKPEGFGRKGKNNHKSRSVICNETGKQYVSLIDCSRDTGLCVRTIQNHCQGKVRTTHHSNRWSGFTFSYLD